MISRESHPDELMSLLVTLQVVAMHALPLWGTEPRQCRHGHHDVAASTRYPQPQWCIWCICLHNHITGPSNSAHVYVSAGLGQCINDACLHFPCPSCGSGGGEGGSGRRRRRHGNGLRARITTLPKVTLGTCKSARINACNIPGRECPFLLKTVSELWRLLTRCHPDATTHHGDPRPGLLATSELMNRGMVVAFLTNSSDSRSGGWTDEYVDVEAKPSAR